MSYQSMKVSREVILDLLPLYLADEASAATRLLIEQYLSQDEELAKEVRSQLATGFDHVTPPIVVPPELELSSLQRTRIVLRRQRWLFGIAIGASVLALTSRLSFSDGRLTSFRFLVQEYPGIFGPIAIGAIGCWMLYFRMARQGRMGPRREGPR